MFNLITVGSGLGGLPSRILAWGLGSSAARIVKIVYIDKNWNKYIRRIAPYRRNL